MTYDHENSLKIWRNLGEIEIIHRKLNKHYYFLSEFF